MVEHAGWKCNTPACIAAGQHRASPLKSIRMTKLPTVMIVQLVRWHYDQEGGSVTISHAVRPEHALTVGGTRYQLCSVVSHNGPRATAGHYIAFACHRGRWWLYDDEHSREATDAETTTFSRCNRRDKTYIAMYVQELV